MKPPSIPLNVFHICVYDAKIRYEIAYASMSLLYGTISTFSTSISGYVLTYMPCRYCGVHFDRPSIPPRSGQDFDTCCDDCTGCYDILPGHFYFPHHPGLIHNICEGKARSPLVQRYLDLQFPLSDDQESLKLTPAMYVLPQIFERCDRTYLDFYTQSEQHVRGSH